MKHWRSWSRCRQFTQLPLKRSSLDGVFAPYAPDDEVYAPYRQTVEGNRHREGEKAFVIRKTRLNPNGADTKRQLVSIAQRAVSTVIQTQGVGDLESASVTGLRRTCGTLPSPGSPR